MMWKLALALAVTATAAGADPVEGMWQTIKDDNGHYGHIAVGACGEAICGTLVAAFDADGNPIDSPNIGRQIVWDMVPQGNGVYDDGKVWSPDRDATYNADMTLTGDSLAVRGCLLGICRNGGTWTRVQ